MTKELIFFIIDALNSFPSKGSASTTDSPNFHVLGHPRPDLSLPFVTFGSYCLVYIGSTNTTKSRAVPAIALRPSNLVGGFYFMSLYTGKRLNAYKWTELPIDQDVIDRVHELGTLDHQPSSQASGLLFEWQPGIPIDDAQGAPLNLPDAIDTGEHPPYDHHANANNETNANETNPNDNANNENGTNANDNDFVNNNNNDDDPDKENDDDIDDYDNDRDNVAHDDDDNNAEEEILMSPHTKFDIENNDSHVQGAVGNVALSPAQGAKENEHDVLSEASKSVGSAQEEQRFSDGVTTLRRSNRTNKGTNTVLEVTHDARKKYEVRRHKYFLQRSRKRHRPKIHLQFLMKQRKQASETEQSLMDIALSFIFAQRKVVKDKNGNEVINNKEMPAAKGFKVFGEEAVAAMLKEFSQLHNGVVPGKPVVAPIRLEDITPEEMPQVMEAVNLIKRKRNGTMKGRSCINGSKQKKFLKQDESIASPTVCLEAILMTLGIDIYEERDVAIFDVPGAYLHAKMPEHKNVIMVLRGTFVDIMCQVDTRYEEFVTVNSKGQKVLYLKILRALYGCIESALLWYDLYASILQQMGFKINPYDRCVANKIINGRQCTICWYVDDNKISHADENVVTEVLNEVEKHFGTLVTSRGNKHDLLGMKLELDRKNKRVLIDTSDHIQEAIVMFEQQGDEVAGEVSNPGNNQFYKEKIKSDQLVAHQADIFHSTVAKLLFIGKRGRPDLEPYIAYLCTRVNKSTNDDWNKLKRVLQFAKQTVNDKRIIGAETLDSLYTWVDAAYAIHPDMRSQTGGLMSFGHGAVHCKSAKQKLNTKSSTESELVGISDYLPYNIWMRMFLEEQGYELKSNVLFQDNQSTIRMGTNGRTSCTGNSRHIDIRYFFVADRVKKKEMKIRYCPSEMMLADYFTKPLQGKLFHSLRNIIMGNVSIFELMEQYLPLKERVGNNSVLEKEEKDRKSTAVKDLGTTGTDEKKTVSQGYDGKNTVPSNSNKKKTLSWADVVRSKDGEIMGS